MSDHHQDRRVQRTREQLRNALMQLVFEKGYDAVTINEITERANLGRTTFYLHYQSKDDLLLDHHADFTAHFHQHPLNQAELLGNDPHPEMVELLRRYFDGKTLYLTLMDAKDPEFIMRGIRQQWSDSLRASLQAAFGDAPPKIPLDVLINYVVGAQLALMDWWIRNRTPHTPEAIATSLHQLQAAAIREAYALA